MTNTKKNKTKNLSKLLQIKIRIMKMLKNNNKLKWKQMSL